jgi:mono/diheme cytochrome c family protein
MRILYRFCCALLLVSLSARIAAGDDASPDFGRDVRPILAKHCFTCHGPDEGARESDLRLDEQEAATEDLGGYAAISPGEPDA